MNLLHVFQIPSPLSSLSKIFCCCRFIVVGVAISVIFYIIVDYIAIVVVVVAVCCYCSHCTLTAADGRYVGLHLWQLRSDAEIRVFLVRIFSSVQCPLGP